MLGEGVIALKAVNNTAESADQAPAGQRFTWWQYLLMAVAGLVGLCCIGGLVKFLLCR